MRLLLLSNSTMAGEPYLKYPMAEINRFIGTEGLNILFIPYAAVTFSYDHYEANVAERFWEYKHRVTSIHQASDPREALQNAEVIVVGGGNTWKLVHDLHTKGLMGIIREKVLGGTPYIGWSAGSNIACPTLRTTNDMPIIHPGSFDCLGLVPFQINPHYLDAHPENHGGETREQRIQEFIALNPEITVVGLREGTMLEVNDSHLQLIGKRPMRIFQNGAAPAERNAGEQLDFLLK